ncbi:MAG: signal peptidase I [Armatimonadia bacterium]
MAGSGSRKRLQWLIASLVVVVGVIVALQLLFPLRLYSIHSGAMEPTIRIGGTVVVNHLAYWRRPVQFQDMVLIRNKAVGQRSMVKRIVGLPGDRLRVHAGKLWRNGQVVDEKYLKEPMAYEWPKKGELTVPAGRVGCLGDNRNDSNDSHIWQDPFLPVSEILGKVVRVSNPGG